MNTRTRSFQTPLGPLLAVVDAEGLRALSFDAPSEPSPASSPVLDLLERELAEYFAGSLRVFLTPMAPKGTPFQQRVWAELLRIPWGETISYATLARPIGSPAALRAVGAANGANPIPILIPCHRVIASDGSLHGYSAGLQRKRDLLDLERAPALWEHTPATPPTTPAPAHTATRTAHHVTTPL